jgi:hypothetical protein
MTFPEQKTYYTQITGTNTTQYRTDHYLADNYDFIGAEKYSHVSDAAFVELRIDSAKANELSTMCQEQAEGSERMR